MGNIFLDYVSNFNKMKATSFASLNYSPTPFEYPSSGFFGVDNKGALEESNDSRAAYTQALMWYLTDDERYAENAVKILNAWGSVCKGHKGPNWSLNAAWNGSIFPMAAEIMRKYEGWKAEDIEQFKNMLSVAFLRILNNRNLYGNRMFSGINALMAIGVFNDDRAAFYQGVLGWLDYVPTYFYIDEDNQNPASPNYWRSEVKPSTDEYLAMQGTEYPEGENWLLLDNNPFNNNDDSTAITSGRPGYENFYGGLPLYNGQLGESGRDYEHAEMGFSAAVNAAEIAYHQGIDLYSVYQERIIAASELHTSLRMGMPVPDDFCGGTVTPLSASATYETAYNHYANRMGIEMPRTEEYIRSQIRRWPAEGKVAPLGFAGTKVGGQISLTTYYESLTHGKPMSPQRLRRSLMGLK